MHPTILAKRKAEAVAKLVFTADALAELLNLDPALVAGLHPVGVHDNQLREMMLLEGAANLIQAVAIAAGAIREGVSMETPEPEAHWVEPVAPANPSPPETEQPELSAESEFLRPEAIDEALAETEPVKRPVARKTTSSARKRSKK